MKLLTKRRFLKGKGFAVMKDMKDMTPDIVKSLKEPKDKSSVEDVWNVDFKKV